MESILPLLSALANASASPDRRLQALTSLKGVLSGIIKSLTLQSAPVFKDAASFERCFPTLSQLLADRRAPIAPRFLLPSSYSQHFFLLTRRPNFHFISFRQVLL